MDEAFIRKDILQDVVKISGKLSNQLSIEHNRIVATFSQFRHKVTKQRVFCIIISQINWYFIINTLVDLNPKPLISCSARTLEKFELQLTISDNRNCNIRFNDKKAFFKWQKCCSEAIAEALCCEAMKPLISGRLSLTRMNRCLSTCNTLTRDCPLIIQIKRLRSIRNKINQTMKELIEKKAIIADPDIIKMKASFNFVQYVYPSMQQDPDLQFLTTKLCSNKDDNSNDLKDLCKLLLHIDQEDKTEFLSMIRQSKPSPSKKMHNNSTKTSLPLSPKKRSILKSHNWVNSCSSDSNISCSSSKQTAKKNKRHQQQQHVSWDISVKSNEKRRRPHRQSNSPLQVRTPSGGKENSCQSSVYNISTPQQSPEKSMLPQEKVQKDNRMATSMPPPILLQPNQSTMSAVVQDRDKKKKGLLLSPSLNTNNYSINTGDTSTGTDVVSAMPIAVAVRNSPCRSKYKPRTSLTYIYNFYTLSSTVVILCTVVVCVSLLFWLFSSLSLSAIQFGSYRTELSTLTLSISNTATIRPITATATIPAETIAPLSSSNISDSSTISTDTIKNNKTITLFSETTKYESAASSALKHLSRTTLTPLRWVKYILSHVRNYISRIFQNTKNIKTTAI